MRECVGKHRFLLLYFVVFVILNGGRKKWEHVDCKIFGMPFVKN